MKVCLVACLLSMMASVVSAQQEQDIVKQGQPMPSFTIVSDDGKELKSDAFKGKVILINFFATWCGPCQKELAVVQEKLWPKYRNNKNFVMLVIGREHSDSELKEYNDKKGFSFSLYPDKDRAIYSRFALSLIPRTYLIGKDGKIIHTAVGYNDADFEVLMTKIETALK